MGYNARVGPSSNFSEKDLERNDRNVKSMDIKAASFTDIARAEATDKYGHVHRGLKARHVQFIALGGAIGTGLFLGIGRALSKSGPLSLVLGYAIVGIAIFMMMMALGEMAAWLPLPGAIPQFCSRYVDEALGFAVGWNTWFTAVITLCAEISAACSLIQFWEGAEHINNAVWIVILIVLVLGLNIFAVSIYGEAEFIFASIKVVTILGLLILSLVIDLGGSPKQPRLGFHYWKTDGAMKEYISAGDTGRFLGLFSTLVNAAFSMGGIETVAVAAGEAEDPRRNIPKAVKRVFWRILFFYVIGALAVGVICPSNDQNLLGSGSSRAQSPWVIAINLAGIRALPSIINVVIISSATSAGNAYVYTGSRYLYALAQNNHAPKVFLYCTGRGVPIYSVLLTASISLLSFMSISASSSVVFEWFQNLTTIANIFTWISICIAYIRFNAALKAQHVNRSTLPFAFPLQPYLAYIALVFFSIVLIFNGFDSIAGGWDYKAFLTSYIGFPLFFGLFVFWKIVKRTKWKTALEADIFTGKAEIDAMEWPRQEPRNFVEKVWFWIA